MNYLMLLSFTIPVAIILFLLSYLSKEENKIKNEREQAENASSGNQTTGEPCYQRINGCDKKNPNDYTDFSGGNWGI